MSRDLEADLRAAFDAASESVNPRPDLADLVRQSARRRGAAAAASAFAAIAIGVAAVYLTSGSWTSQRQAPRPTAGRHLPAPRLVPRTKITLATGEEVAALAAGGQYLYLATDYSGNPPYALSAYDRVTGRLIRRVSVPAEPAALHVGPGGSVWLTFYADQAGGPSGTWLLSADLSRRSASQLGSTDVLPTSPDTAELAWQRALVRLTMPPPGTLGRVAGHADPAEKLDGRLAVDTLTGVAGRIAALVTNGYGFHGHVVIAGQPGLTFAGGPDQQARSFAAEANGLWVTTGRNDSNVGPLVRLSPALRVITPRDVRANPILRRSEQVWSQAHTVWVATAAPHHALICFTYRDGMGPITTIPLHGRPIGLAAAGGTVYVTLSTDVVGITSDVLGYAIPSACR